MCAWLKAPLKAVYFFQQNENDEWNIEVFLIWFIMNSARWARWVSVKPNKLSQILLIGA